MLSTLVGEDKVKDLISTSWDSVPLVVFLDKLGSKSKASKSKLSEIAMTLEMIRFLAEPLKKDFDVNQILIHAQIIAQVVKMSNLNSLKSIEPKNPKKPFEVEKISKST
jgi:hypothetical protein